MTPGQLLHICLSATPMDPCLLRSCNAVALHCMVLPDPYACFVAATRPRWTWACGCAVIAYMRLMHCSIVAGQALC